MKSLRRTGSAVAARASRQVLEGAAEEGLVGEHGEGGRPARSRRPAPRRPGSTSARIAPREGERRLNSAMTLTRPGRRERGREAAGAPLGVGAGVCRRSSGSRRLRSSHVLARARRGSAPGSVVMRRLQRRATRSRQRRGAAVVERRAGLPRALAQVGGAAGHEQRGGGVQDHRLAAARPPRPPRTRARDGGVAGGVAAAQLFRGAGRAAGVRGLDRERPHRAVVDLRRRAWAPAGDSSSRPAPCTTQARRDAEPAAGSAP